MPSTCLNMPGPRHSSSVCGGKRAENPHFPTPLIPPLPPTEEYRHHQLPVRGSKARPTVTHECLSQGNVRPKLCCPKSGWKCPTSQGPAWGQPGSASTHSTDTHRQECPHLGAKYSQSPRHQSPGIGHPCPFFQGRAGASKCPHSLPADGPEENLETKSCTFSPANCGRRTLSR